MIEKNLIHLEEEIHQLRIHDQERNIYNEQDKIKYIKKIILPLICITVKHIYFKK
jgi:hypothetical protein